LQTDRLEDKEQLSFWKQAQIRNRTWTKNPGKKTAFEFGPNLLGFKLIWKNSGKFPKILICLDLA
jgi:hypothetical protein